MKVIKCEKCGNIFFEDDGSSNDHRSLEAYLCTKCSDEHKEEIRRYEGRHVSPNQRKHCENCGGSVSPLEGIIPDFCGQVCFEAALIRKIRRRIEDRLRKTEYEEVLAVARLLGIPEDFS